MATSSKRGKLHPDSSGGFASLQRAFYETMEYRLLSPPARALLVEFALRFRGANNGNLEMTEEQFRTAGLGSPSTLRRYLFELINAGWIVVTRQGGLGRCSLYALTYLPINETAHLYDIPWKAATTATHLWKAENAAQRDIRQKKKGRRRIDRLRRPEKPNSMDTAQPPM